MKLIIGNKNYSSWSLRPWLLMSYFGLDFEEIKIPLYTPHTDELMGQLCPTKKVPTLHDEEIIWDSLAICEYINEQYLESSAYPQETKKRARARVLVSEMHSGFMAIRNTMSMDIRARGKTYHFDAELAKEIQRVDEVWSRKEGDFIMGEFGIVDCFYAPIAFRFRTFDVPLSASAKQYQQTLLNLPSLKAWEMEAENEVEIIK